MPGTTASACGGVKRPARMAYFVTTVARVTPGAAIAAVAPRLREMVCAMQTTLLAVATPPRNAPFTHLHEREAIADYDRHASTTGWRVGVGPTIIVRLLY